MRSSLRRADADGAARLVSNGPPRGVDLRIVDAETRAGPAGGPGRRDLAARAERRGRLPAPAGGERGEVRRAHRRRRGTLPAHRRPRRAARRRALRHRAAEGPADRQRAQPLPAGHRGGGREDPPGAGHGAGRRAQRRRRPRAHRRDPRRRRRRPGRHHPRRARRADPGDGGADVRRARAQRGARQAQRRPSHDERQGPAPVDAGGVHGQRRRGLVCEAIDPAVQRVRASASGGMTQIAIVGMDGRFPQAPDLDALWKLLLAGEDGIAEVPADRWPVADYYDAQGGPGKSNTRNAGFLSDADAFDHEFFAIAPSEAAAMDPQQRLLLQTAWRALEDATIDPRSVAGSNTGVYVGLMASEWSSVRLIDFARITAHHGVRRRLLHERQPPLLPPRSQGPERRRRHGLLLVAGRRAAGVRRVAGRCVRPGAGGRGQPRPDAGAEHLLHAGRAVRARRTLQAVQHARGRHRPRRGRRGARAAPAGRRRRRRPADLRGDRRRRRQLRRPQQRDHGAQPVGAEAGGARTPAATPAWSPSRSTSSRPTAPAPCSAT